jgi:hypothetical protein
VTIGDDLNTAAHFLTAERASYSAADVVKELLSKVDVAQVADAQLEVPPLEKALASA